MKKTTARPWRTFGFWIPVAILLAAFATGHQTLTSALARQRQMQTDLYQQQRTLGENAERKANEFLQDYRRKFAADPPITYAEQVLSGGAQLPVSSRYMIWTDDQGGQASLEIDSGRWTGTRAGGPYKSRPPLPYANIGKVLTAASNAAFASSIGVWLFLAVITAGTCIPFHKRPRKVILTLCVHLLLLSIATLALAILNASDDWEFSMPNVPPTLLAGLTFVTISVVVLIISGKRVHAHPRCLKCGYNLTKNTSGTCPECGKSIIEAF